ncbi:MAG: hypothetical protein MUP11_00840 [Anaerolineales bacterium]|nr:hypothetical protein [Anaerolineales bacterium]
MTGGFSAIGLVLAELAAETEICLATADEVRGISGKYYYQKQPIISSRISY